MVLGHLCLCRAPALQKPAKCGLLPPIVPAFVAARLSQRNPAEMLGSCAAPFPSPFLSVPVFEQMVLQERYLVLHQALKFRVSAVSLVLLPRDSYPGTPRGGETWICLERGCRCQTPPSAQRTLLCSAAKQQVLHQTDLPVQASKGQKLGFVGHHVSPDRPLMPLTSTATNKTSIVE